MGLTFHNVEFVNLDGEKPRAEPKKKKAAPKKKNEE